MSASVHARGQQEFNGGSKQLFTLASYLISIDQWGYSDSDERKETKELHVAIFPKL